MKQPVLAMAALAAMAGLSAARAQTVDTLPEGWSRQGPAFGTAAYRVELDRKVAHGGQGSLRVSSERATPAEWAGATQLLRADDMRGRRIRLSGYVKVAAVGAAAATGAGMFLRVDGSAGGVPFDNMGERPLTGTSDWQRLELVLDVPKDATRIGMGVLLQGAGTLWVDDLELAEVPSTVPVTGRVLAAAAPPALDPALAAAPRNLDFEGPVTVVARATPAYERRTEMVRMRDGVRLYTVINMPRSTEPLPILLQRTPYGAGGALRPELAADGYIFVTQDIRGRNRSEGEFIMNRPARDARDPKSVDETTDAWDTVDWLIRNLPGHNGRVGVMGISYPGWLAEVVLLDPHPAVKAVSPQAPMTDTWLGDDFFHQGAFRQTFGFLYSWALEGEKAGAGPQPATSYDLYEWFRSFPSLQALTVATGSQRLPTWRRVSEHPAWDEEWQGRAFQQLVKRLTVPTLTVGGWWDAEDLFGAQSTYTTLESLDTAHLNYVVIGPWSHGQWAQSGATGLGDVAFGSATSDTFRLRMEAPFFAHYLKDRDVGAIPEARVFDAGRNEWRTFEQWPPQEATPRSLYFRADGRLSFEPPPEPAGSDQYVSDPAYPVPYLARPVESTNARWSGWMAEDQRFVEGRPDVLTWQTEPLADDVTIAGDVIARLFAATTGSDADWVVKLIDVYPATLPAPRRAMGGYQLMVAGDIMRGRYRESWERPAPIRPDVVEEYRVDLHQQCYTFRAGHRIMVQLHSTWFPLYDRNPQTWVPNIFEAPAAAYRAQTHRIQRSAAQASRLEVGVLPRPVS